MRPSRSRSLIVSMLAAALFAGCGTRRPDAAADDSAAAAQEDTAAVQADSVAADPAPQGAQAQPAYPLRPVKIIVSFSPGGTTDILARMIGQKLAQAMGQPFVVENKPGAGGIVGNDIVAKSPADGYTLLIGSTSSLAVNTSLYSKFPYDPQRDLAPIVLFGKAPFTGRLPVTWPRSVAQEPINVGDASYDPLYPFGWGIRTGRAHRG